MAHYDCTNCGASMGIAWGCCTKCTPPEYLKLHKLLSDVAAEAEKEWDEAHKKERDDYIKGKIEHISSAMKRIEKENGQ